MALVSSPTAIPPSLAPKPNNDLATLAVVEIAVLATGTATLLIVISVVLSTVLAVLSTTPDTASVALLKPKALSIEA